MITKVPRHHLINIKSRHDNVFGKCVEITPEWHLNAAVFLRNGSKALLESEKGLGRMRANKSPPLPSVAAPRHCRVNEVLCHQMEPQGPLAHKTQNQLFLSRFPLNFATSTCASSALFPSSGFSGISLILDRGHFLRSRNGSFPSQIKGTITVSADRDLHVCEGPRGLVLSRHNGGDESGAKSWSPSRRWTVRQHWDADHSGREAFQKKKPTTAARTSACYYLWSELSLVKISCASCKPWLFIFMRPKQNSFASNSAQIKRILTFVSGVKIPFTSGLHCLDLVFFFVTFWFSCVKLIFVADKVWI